MKLTKNLTEKILTGLNYGPYEKNAEPPAEDDEDFQEWVDEIANLVAKHSNDMVSALVQYVSDSSADVRAHELKDFAKEHYKASGMRVGEVLKEYAQSSEMGELFELFEALDKAGGVDWFEWEQYADSGMTPVSGLHFVMVPTTGFGNDSVFLFED